MLGGIPVPEDGLPPYQVAFWVFVAAIVTDLLDGWAARLLDAHSETGLWLDPLADKMLTDSTWAALGWTGLAPAWLCIAMVARDAIILVVWAVVLTTGTRLRWAPSATGQVMVAFEGVALCVFLFHGPWLDVHWPSVATVLGGGALVLSHVSLAQYALNGPERT